MKSRGCRLGLRSLQRLRVGLNFIPALLILIVAALLAPSFGAQRNSPRRNILIISELGESHRGSGRVTKELVDGLTRDRNYHIEFYSESLDSETLVSEESQREIKEWIVHKYRDQKLDVVVAVGPSAIAFLSSSGQPTFPDVPVVICCGFLGSAQAPQLGPRFTGTWLRLDSTKTIDVALRLFPDTQHIAIVAGSSDFDRARLAQAREGLQRYAGGYEFIDLTDLPIEDLLSKLRQLPKHTIVFYISLFRDASGQLFVNATTSLPMVAEASSAPVFGVSDTYIGNGIVGGSVMSFGEQGRITTQIVSEILEGKKPEEIPTTIAPDVYMFDWRELHRWHIREGALPAGSVVYFREPSFWERTWWIWITSLSIILCLSGLAVYLHYSRKQLELAKERQKQLTGMLINAGEQERRRIASELHDDFSQRLAVLALKLENVAEAVSPFSQEADRQLHELLNSTSELGADLHTLSHGLHSSTLESLGLVPAVGALCKEFTTQQGVDVTFRPEGIPQSVNPDAALCVFRIVQEGLRNMKKHSGAKEALVSLRVVGGRLDVSVVDRGSGFDMRELRQKEGLGVRSMEERACLLGGEFRIESAPGKGTTVEAWVPLDQKV